jgi:hypothetical protein
MAARSPMTDYFRRDVLPKQSYLRLEGCLAVLKQPIRREVQSDGRIRHWGYWGYVPKLGKYLRVVTLEDGIPSHSAFPDRRFKP